MNQLGDNIKALNRPRLAPAVLQNPTAESPQTDGLGNNHNHASSPDASAIIKTFTPNLTTRALFRALPFAFSQPTTTKGSAYEADNEGVEGRCADSSSDDDEGDSDGGDSPGGGGDDGEGPGGSGEDDGGEGEDRSDDKNRDAGGSDDEAYLAGDEKD